MARESRRTIGLELSGAKNNKTAMAVLEYYPAEEKTFLLDIFDRVSIHEQQSPDDALIELIGEFHPGISKLGVNVPLEIPPCISCVRKQCPTMDQCAVPAIKWMRDTNKKMLRTPEKGLVRDFTGYTQRPVELWMRYRVLSRLPQSHRFEVDETLGGNRAPLTARMSYLKRHLTGLPMVEVWPKLSVAHLALELGLPRRTIASYRDLDRGSSSREEILESLIERFGVFIYDRDLRKLSGSLSCFDAFICAYTALLSDIQECEKPPQGFPVNSGWVQYPKGCE